MVDHGRVESNVRPNRLELDEFSVWVAENIKEEQREMEDETETIFTYDLKQYTKDEYILERLDSNKTSSDLAIAELAEAMIGGAF